MAKMLEKTSYGTILESGVAVRGAE